MPDRIRIGEDSNIRRRTPNTKIAATENTDRKDRNFAFVFPVFFAANSVPVNDAFAQALIALPHGPEFRFLDRLTALVPGQSGAGEYTLRGDEPFLRGHFPGHPLMPGVLLVEGAAQLAGTVAQSDPNVPPLKNLKLTAIRGAKILGSAQPGETIQLEARVLGRMGNLIQAQGTARVGERVVLQCELTLSGDA